MRESVVGQFVVVAIGSALLIGCGTGASTGGMDSGMGAGSTGTTAGSGGVGSGGSGSSGSGSGGVIILTGNGGSSAGGGSSGSTGSGGNGSGGSLGSGGSVSSGGGAGQGNGGVGGNPGKGGAAGSGAGGRVGNGGGGSSLGGAGGTGVGGTGGPAPRPSAGCGATNPPASGTYMVTVDGAAPQYILTLPDGYDRTHPYRLILAFHGHMYTAQSVADGGPPGSGPYYGIESEAKGSAIFIAPQAIGSGWSSSDLDFVDAMVSGTEAQLCVDEGRVFATGFS